MECKESKKKLEWLIKFQTSMEDVDIDDLHPTLSETAEKTIKYFRDKFKLYDDDTK